MTHKIIVLGGGYAGVLAACRLAATLRNAAQVTLVNRAPHFVERIRLHQVSAGQSVPARTLSHMIDGTGAAFVQGEARALDPHAHTLTVGTADGDRTLGYDALVYALGSTISPHGLDGASEHAHLLTQGGAETLHARLQALPGSAAVAIIGGGLTAIEAATEYAEAYPQLRLTLYCAGPLGADLSDKGRAYLHKVFADLRITVADCTPVARVAADHLVTADGAAHAFDVCLYAGAFGVPALARAAGLPVTDNGQLRVDAQLRVLDHPHIYGAGDAAHVSGVRMACATAMPMAANAAHNLIASLRGQPLRDFRMIYRARCISLGRTRGLIQWVRADDTPLERITTERAGAWFKEGICRFTLWALEGERRWPGLYPL
jgi:NADH:ubiquinone reductase (H+-translocating)